MIHLTDNHRIRLYEPQLDDMWFRQMLLSDPETMSYNHAWGGTIQFANDRWKVWFDHWIASPCGERFYRYVTLDNSRIYIGEAAWHHDKERDLWLIDIIIHSRYRGHGYGQAALKLLCEEAKKNGISVLHDDIAIDNPAISLFLQNGFKEEYRTSQIIMLRKDLLSS